MSTPPTALSRGTAVLDGVGQDALLVEGAHRVRIQNITVRGGSLGIFVRGAGTASLSNITIADNARGLQVSGGSSARLDNNILIEGSGDFGLVSPLSLVSTTASSSKITVA